MRLVLLAPSVLQAFDLRVLEYVFACDRIEIVGAVLDARPGKSRTQRIREELRKGRGGYVLVMVVHDLLRRLHRPQREDAAAYFAARGVPTLSARKLYADETLDWIRACRPDALFRSAFGIIREPILSIAPGGVLSYHHGNIRRYRGQPVAFWELYHGEREMGVTIQRLNAGLDSGAIVKEIVVPIHRTDSWATLYRRAYDASPALLRDACLAMEQPGFSPITIPEEQLGRVFTSPNFRKWLSLQLRVMGRKLRGEPKL